MINVFFLEPLKVRLLAGEQKATKLPFIKTGNQKLGGWKGAEELGVSKFRTCMEGSHRAAPLASLIGNEPWFQCIPDVALPSAQCHFGLSDCQRRELSKALFRTYLIPIVVERRDVSC